MREISLGLVGRGAALESMARATRELPGRALAWRSEPASVPPGVEVVVGAGLRAHERVWLAALAADASFRVAVPPLPVVDGRSREALVSGRAVQVSLLLGYAPLARAR